MTDLIRDGKILHWGISEAIEEYLRRAHAVCPVIAVQNHYSMMARQYEKCSLSLKNQTWPLAFSPLANGLLTKCYTAETRFDVRMDYRAVMPQFQMKSFEQNESLFSLIDRLAEKYHAIPSQIALSWTMNKRPWIIPILGTCHLCRLKENAGAADVHMTDEKVKEIDIELEMMEMSEVFGGSPIKNNYSIVELLKNVNAMALQQQSLEILYLWLFLFLLSKRYKSMEECKDIMVIDWATRIPTDAEEEYLSHLFCLGGGC